MGWLRVQSNSKTQTTSGSTITIAPTTSNLTAGNRLVVVVSCQGSATRTVTSVVDNATGGSNTYNAEASSVEASDTERLSIYTAQIVNGGGAKPTITVTFSGTTFWSNIAVIEYSGCSTSAGAIADKSATNNSTTNTTAWSTGTTAATTAANQLVIAAAADPLGMNTADVTYGSSLTKVVSDFNTGTSDWTVAEKDSGASGSTISGSWTSPTARPYAAAVVVLKLAAGGGTTNNQSATATVTTSVSLVRSIGTTKTVTSALVPTVAKGIATTKSAAVALAASLARSIGKAAVATVATSSTATRRVGKTFVATVTTSASAASIKARTLAVSATVATTSSVTRGLGITRSAVVATAASFTRQAQLSRLVTTTVSTAGAVLRGIGKSLSSTVTTSSTTVAVKARLLTLLATVNTSSVVSKLIGKTVTTQVVTSPTYARQIAKTLAGTVATQPSTTKGIGKFVVGNVVTVATVTPSVSGGSFDGSVVAWIPYIPDEAALGLPVTLRVVFAAADGSRPALDSAPTARVFIDDVSGTETVLSGPTLMTASGTGWVLTYTPTVAGPQALEVRGKLVGATQFSCFGFTVRPRFDPVALAVGDVLVSRM